MNSAAEGLFAAVGAFVVTGTPVVLLVALANRVGRSRKPSSRPPAAVPEYPEPRNHEPGQCWCGDEHADRFAGDDAPAWRAS